MTTRVERHGEVAVLAVAGVIDLLTGPALERAIKELLGEDPPAVVVDLTEVKHMESVGLSILMSTSEQLDGRSPLAVVARDPATVRPIQLTGLDAVLALYASLEGALQGVSEAGVSTPDDAG